MHLDWFRNIVLAFTTTLILTFGADEIRAAQSGESVDTIIQKAVTRTERAESMTPPDLDYTKSTMTQEVGDDGRIREQTRRLYRVSCRNGCFRSELVSVNGQPPKSSDRERRAENELTLQKLLGDSKKTAGANENNFLTSDVAAKFDFRLIGTTNVNRRPAYQIAFRPKSPAGAARGIVDRVLNRISGTLWVDCAEYEVARADVFLDSEVNLFGGIAGSLKKLAYTIVRTRVTDTLWINTLSFGDIEGRKLFDSMRVRTQSEATDFVPAG